MSANDRFSRLEDKRALPENVRAAIAKLNRFSHLEIGGLKSAPPVAPGPVAVERRLCPHCNQANEKGRLTCWACYRPLDAPAEARKPDPGQDVELVLDGVSYQSNDPELPPDIRALIGRIRLEGYSRQLLADWQSWRAVRNVPGRAQTKFDMDGVRERVEVVDGRYVDVIRIDNVVYRSDDPALSAELKEIFAYIDREGVTPALMQHLRLYGPKVKFRPASTVTPSDGDIDFWKSVWKALK
jgi:hypothetical protein